MLASEKGAFTEEAIQQLDNPLARRVEVHKEIGSTQERARQLALSGAPHGTLVLSEVQTGGLGRRGRSWGSPAGGLWMSLVLRLDLEHEHTPRITQAAAVGVAKTLRSIGVEARIKWPNDLLVEGRKICGILAAGGPDFVALGIGLNANLNPEDLDAPPENVATIRAVLGHDVDKTQLLKTLLSNLNHELQRIKDFDAILADWRRLDCTLGERVRVQSSRGVYRGWALDLTREGALLLDTENGVVELFEGDVERLRF